MAILNELDRQRREVASRVQGLLAITTPATVTAKASVPTPTILISDEGEDER